MFDYEEACPISRASTILCERWTLQIIREMLFGATRFSELQHFLPRLSPTLLNTRLRTLEDAGIVVRKKIAEKKGYEYRLTPSGQALKPVLMAMGKWGINWVFDAMDPDQLNLSALVRDFAVALRVDQLPEGDSTIQITFSGEERPARKFILVRQGAAQTCEDNMGTDVDVYLTADRETFGRIWFGEISVLSAVKTGRLKVVGTTFYVRTVSRWLGVSELAAERLEKSA